MSITVEQPGLLSTLQDRGRFGMRHLGIPWSGCLVPYWQQCANLLVTNPVNQPVIESWEAGLSLHINEQAVKLAMCAHSSAQLVLITEDKVQRQIPAFCSFTAPEGSTVQLKTSGDFRHVVIALSGIDVQPHLGSCSTYAKASLGGLTGSALKPGDQLFVNTTDPGPDLVIEPLHYEPCDEHIIRVVLGPQLNHFADTGIEHFLSKKYRVSAEADRMGVRLEGPEVFHLNAEAKDIVSDAIVPGSIQIPGNSQPIVLLNDAHTAGGYPKIATVISTDLPWLGLLRQGALVKFHALEIEAALEVTRTHQQSVVKSLQTLAPKVVTELSNEVLFSNNLIDGVTSALT